jgi:hypothetical protein
VPGKALPGAAAAKHAVSLAAQVSAKTKCEQQQQQQQQQQQGKMAKGFKVGPDKDRQ